MFCIKRGGRAPTSHPPARAQPKQPPGRCFFPDPCNCNGARPVPVQLHPAGLFGSCNCNRTDTPATAAGYEALRTYMLMCSNPYTRTVPHFARLFFRDRTYATAAIREKALPNRVSCTLSSTSGRVHHHCEPPLTPTGAFSPCTRRRPDISPRRQDAELLRTTVRHAV